MLKGIQISKSFLTFFLLLECKVIYKKKKNIYFILLNIYLI